jgi:hypothetical protein
MNYELNRFQMMLPLSKNFMDEKGTMVTKNLKERLEFSFNESNNLEKAFSDEESNLIIKMPDF